MTDDEHLTAKEAERAHLRGPAGKQDRGFRRMQELRKVSRDYQDDGAHYLG